MLSLMLLLEVMQRGFIDIDAKQLRKIAKTGNHFFILFVLHCEIYTSRSSVVLCVHVCVHQLTLTLEIRIFYLRIGWVGGWVIPRKYKCFTD